MVSFDYVAATGSADAYQTLTDRLPSSNGSVEPRHFSAVAEGPAADCRLALKATRDAFAGEGDAHGGLGDLLTCLRGALLAANALLIGRGSPGISLLAAAADPSGEVIVAYCGDCHALLWRRSEAALERLTKEEYRHHLLGPLANPPIGQEYRALRDGDRLILCSGSLFDALTESQVEECCQQHEHEAAPRLADALYQAARAAEGGGRPALLVIGTEPMAGPLPSPPPVETMPEAPAPPPGSTTNGAPSHFVPPFRTRPKAPPFFQPRLSPRTYAEPDTSWAEPAAAPEFPVASLPPVGRRVALVALTTILTLGVLLGGAVLGRRAFPAGIMVVPEAAIAGELAPAAANPAPPDLFQGRSTQAAAAAPDTTALSAVPPAETPADVSASSAAQIQQRVDLLSPRGDAGEVAAIQEIVALLEQLQLLSPGDAQVDDRLRVTRANLVFRQRLQELATYWGDGQTTAETTGSWGRTVEILEALHRLGLPSAHAATVREKLYAAHVNYGKALEAARRPHEAAGQYQRAREIDPIRPEAPNALARLVR